MINDRADSSDQSRTRITTQTILEETRDLRISVRDMSLTLTLGKCLDNLTKATKTEVDRLQLK